MVPEDSCPGLVTSCQCQCHDGGKSQIIQIVFTTVLVATLFFLLGWWASKKTSTKQTKIVATQSHCVYARDRHQPRFVVLPDRDQGAWHQ